MFLSGHRSAASNWCKRSLENLSSQGILDWPLWVLTGKPEECYKRYVRGILVQAEQTRLEAAVLTHKFPIACGELVSPPCTLVKDLLAMRAPWKTLLGHRAIIMLRCGYVTLGHVDGRQSQAKVQACAFCQRHYSNVVFHAVRACHCFDALRQECLALGADFSSLRVLATSISHDAHPKVVQLAEDICGEQRASGGGRCEKCLHVTDFGSSGYKPEALKAESCKATCSKHYPGPVLPPSTSSKLRRR
eukprot:s1239_g2.t1